MKMLLLPSQVLRWISPSQVCTESPLLQIRKIKKSAPSAWVMETRMQPANLPIVGQGSWPRPPPWEQRGQAERKDKTFPSHSFLPQKLLVCSFLLFCRGDVRMKTEGKNTTGHSTLMGLRLSGSCEFGWRIVKHEESLEILQQFSRSK